MNKFESFALVLLITAFFACTCPALSQETAYERFRSHNSSMTAVQPAWMGPLIQSDSRLSQSLRISVSDSYSPGAQPISYGNNHGVSMIVDRRFQFDFDPPSFFRNHSATLKDGFGNAFAQVKGRFASGNAEHGNYALTAILTYGFASGAQQNQMLTATYFPKLAAGKMWGWFDVQTVVNGVLPTGKIAAQGRGIEWNTTAQAHPNAHLWLDIENNALFNLGGPFDGKTQNFVTPAAFYVLRRKAWKPEHAVFVPGVGMQIATTGFHFYNHNLVAELRILF